MRRSASPRRSRGSEGRPSRPYSRQAPPPPPPPPPPRREPGVFKQMAATAAGVAVGSSVGHAVGAAITGGGRRNEVYAAREEYGATEPTGPCAWEIKEFLKCAENQEDITVCAGFNEAIKNCKQQHNLR